MAWYQAWEIINSPCWGYYLFDNRPSPAVALSLLGLGHIHSNCIILYYIVLYYIILYYIILYYILYIIYYILYIYACTFQYIYIYIYVALTCVFIIYIYMYILWLCIYIVLKIQNQNNWPHMLVHIHQFSDLVQIHRRKGRCSERGRVEKKCLLWLKQCHKPSPSHHHFLRWYKPSKMAIIVLPTWISFGIVDDHPWNSWRST